VSASESDATPFSAIRSQIQELEREAHDRIDRLVAQGTTGLANPQSIDAAIASIKEALEPTFFEKIGLFLSSFTDPDELVDVQVLTFLASGLTEQDFNLDLNDDNDDGVCYEVSRRLTDNFALTVPQVVVLDVPREGLLAPVLGVAVDRTASMRPTTTGPPIRRTPPTTQAR
jgi:hypothetical protein